MQYTTTEMLHKHCNMDVRRDLLIYPHSPSGTACPRDHAYISVKPLTAMLQPINEHVSSSYVVMCMDYRYVLYQYLSKADIKILAQYAASFLLKILNLTNT